MLRHPHQQTQSPDRELVQIQREYNGSTTGAQREHEKSSAKVFVGCDYLNRKAVIAELGADCGLSTFCRGMPKAPSNDLIRQFEDIQNLYSNQDY